jgi:hypothetical protein
MDRRALLKSLAAAGITAAFPHDAFAAWDRVAAGLRPASGLTDAQLAHIGAIADVILPRTETPSATDVNVAAFVNVIVTEQWSDAERATFEAHLDAIDPAAIQAIEAGDRRAEPARTYWRLKDLIVHGYFTSEPVMKNVLHVVVMPGKFDGAAPMPMAMQHG